MEWKYLKRKDSLKIHETSKPVILVHYRPIELFLISHHQAHLKLNRFSQTYGVDKWMRLTIESSVLFSPENCHYETRFERRRPTGFHNRPSVFMVGLSLKLKGCSASNS